MPDDPGSWEARYRASLEEEQRALETSESTPAGRMGRGRMWFGLALLTVGVGFAGIVLLTRDDWLTRAGGVLVLAFGAMTVVSVVVGVVQGWRPGRPHGAERRQSHP